MKIWQVLGTILILLAMGCAVTMPTSILDIPADIDNSQITSAAIIALQEQGYVITVANEKIGTVMTDWKDTTGTGLEVLGAFAGADIGRRMKITIAINAASRDLHIKPLKQTKTEMGWKALSLSEQDYEQLNLIVSRICELIGRPTSPADFFHKEQSAQSNF